jgi:GxxExxY protein
VTIDEITGVIIDEAVQIHRDLGPNCFESVYEVVLAVMLERRGMRVERQALMGFTYQGVLFKRGFRADLVVEDVVLIELKAVDRLVPAHRRQVLTYLRLSTLPVGLLLNFGAPSMREGLKRFVNDLPPSASSPLRVNRWPRR